ncbi:MAG: tetratricopeptide repeat protein [SAR324 cluster bacterium]|jgi:tetratricopeptide (TPR) repeat protein|nr:tetratricopeptide repeat protein [SAR324 cluster bacterium]MDP7317612.1 tetratricopeptide repeat protein [SAR324 cluster bacterium]MDP7463356.1 tetratricopeptide repeat protein [SAR324 cluster bacterium]
MAFAENTLSAFPLVAWLRRVVCGALSGMAVLVVMTLPVLAEQEDVRKELDAVRKSLSRYQQLLERLQSVTANLSREQSELSLLVPDEALLDQIARDVNELREGAQQLEKRITFLEEVIASQAEAPGPSTDNSTRLLLEGLLALQVGELQQASGAWETLLTQEQSTVPKDWLLLTLADANRRQERFQEAASNYGTLLRKFPKSQVLPQALYGLGDTFRQMGDTVRQQVIWKELQKAYPEHRLSQQIRRLQASGKTAGAANE